jgi:two-component system NtrC family sensor kinase
VSRTRGIEKIRIFDKEGEIITSTLPAEVGTRVDQSAEACYHCHAAGRPLQQIPGSKRHRIYRSSVGHRVLGTIDVIRNEPACSTADCHAHPESVTVLGVLDVAYSLDAFDTSERSDIVTVAGITAALAVVIFFAAILLVNRLVYEPLEDLEVGARLVSAGDREHLIPVRRPDEIGHLAESFNRMTFALKDSERALAEWAHTLEHKVEEKTAELGLAEAKTMQAEKLASVGLLAAGVAHEINNPLTGVLTFSHLVRSRLPKGSPEAEDMDIIIRETKRCAGIIRRLLDFAREKKPEVSLGDVNAVLRETVQFVEHQAGFQNIAFSVELDPELPAIWMDSNQLKQVVINLIVNARDAMGERGQLSIRSRRLPNLYSPGPGRRAVPAIELTVSDSGCGIPAENLPKIFDPFFTSKEPGKGVGLGLSVGYSIIKAHGGTIFGSVHIPGMLWPVNDWSMANIDELFSVNERVVTWIDCQLGRIAVVMIGATNVGEISVTYDSFISNRGTRQTMHRHYDPPMAIAAGDRLGTFHMGSSVVVLVEPGRIDLSRVRLEAGRKVQYGAAVMHS